ncbi:MAG: histidine phosphatase family protein [Chromatiaceae bacterium]|nr:histidine phosphatase family protein [Chromatiaceae bacterium]
MAWLWGLLALMASPLAASTGQDAFLERLQAGAVILMVRHAHAPGFGDPPEFQLEDCATQRNLDEVGRVQARAMGEWLRARGAAPARVYSSQWCRCLETARLMDLGAVTPLPALNSFFERPQDREANLAALQAFLAEPPPPGELLVLVTHQVSITAVSGTSVASGEGVLLALGEDGALRMLGQIAFGD